MPIEWLDEDSHRLFEEGGLQEIQDFLAFQGGEIISSARTRTCRLIELGGLRYYIKTQDLRDRSLPFRKWPSYLFHNSPILREARSIPLLRSLGWGTPILVAEGCLGGRPWPRASLLITREVEGHVDLARFPGSSSQARAWASALRSLIRDTHAQGFILGGVRFRNFLVPLGEKTESILPSPKSIVILDQPRLRRSKSKRLQQKDFRYIESDLDRLLTKIKVHNDRRGQPS